MKGIILAGGSGTRLYPATLAVSKQLAAGLRQADDLLSARRADAGRHPRDPDHFDAASTCRASRRCSATAALTGSTISYAEQPEPSGLADAFIVGRDFVGDSPVALILGDNIFYGAGLSRVCRKAAARRKRRDRSSPIRSRIPSATAWSSSTRRPATALSIEEKPARAQVQLGRHRASISTTTDVVDIAAGLAPSAARRARDHRRQPRLSRARTTCMSNGSAAALPGSTPARTTACTTPAPSSARSRSGRA